MDKIIEIPFTEGGDEKRDGFFRRLFRKMQPEDATPRLLSARDAFVKSTYGSEKSEVELINEWRESVVRQIDTTMRLTAMHSTPYSTIVTVPDDMMLNMRKLFHPFTEGGYTVHRLKQYIPEFPRDNVFLVSWDGDTKQRASLD